MSQLQPVFQDGAELSRVFDLPLLGTVAAENHVSQLTQARTGFWVVLVGLVPAFLLVLAFQDAGSSAIGIVLEQLSI